VSGLEIWVALSQENIPIDLFRKNLNETIRK